LLTFTSRENLVKKKSPRRRLLQGIELNTCSNGTLRTGNDSRGRETATSEEEVIMTRRKKTKQKIDTYRGR